MVSKRKYYAIKRGRKPGIYTTWTEAKAQVEGFRGAVYRGFLQRQEAEEWLEESVPEKSSPKKARSATKKFAPNNPATSNPNMIILYTDGGSRNTGNVSGGHVRKEDVASWAFLILKDKDKKISGSGGRFGATNNFMEITALIKGLQKVSELYGNDAEVLVVSDSKYVLDTITRNWIWSWQRRGWKKADGKEVVNKELWQEVAKILLQMKHVEFNWTKGHASNAGNVFVDELLNKTMDKMIHRRMKTAYEKSITEDTAEPTEATPPAVPAEEPTKKAALEPDVDVPTPDPAADFEQLGLLIDQQTNGD